MPHTALLSRKPASSRKMASSHPLRRAAGLGLGLLSLLGASVGPACAGTVNWDGTVADWFSNPSHWVGGNYPGAGDDAVNSTTAAMTFNGNDTVNSFFSNGAFSLQSGTFSGSQANSASTLTVNNVFAVDGGTINNFTVNQGTGGSLVFNASSANGLDNSIIDSSMDFASNPGAYTNVFDSVTANGIINMGAGSNIRLTYSGANLTLGSMGGLIGAGTVSEYQGTTLTNNGTINANSSGNTLTLDTTQFNNKGTAEATNGGILSLNNSIANSGLVKADGTGSVVGIAGTFTGTGSDLASATNGGQIQVNGATLAGTINTDASTALVFNASSANGISDGTVINGNLDLATVANAYTNTFGAVTENGNINLGNGGDLRLTYSGASLTLGSAGSLTGAGTVSEYQGTTLANNGTINANSSGNTLNINTTAFNNAGTTEVQNGAALSVTSANTDSGNVLVKTGGTATFSQGLTQTAGLTQADGTLNSPLTLTGGTLAGTGTVNGNVTNTGGTVSAGNSASPFGTLAVSGTFSQNSGGALDVNFSSTQNSLLAVTGAVTTDGTLNVNYLGSGVNTNFAPFTFLDYGSLGTETTNALGFTQYFSNETAINNDLGLIVGSNGFTYDLINNTGLDALQLQVIINGGPSTPAVPEASTNISLGALLMLGGTGLWRAKRRRAVAAAD